jgi:hypothetical protein
VDDSTATEIEELLAQPAIASASPRPSTNMGKRMLNGYAFTQFAASVRGLLALA